ncbi:MAG TPA: hypothetical protein VFA32_04710, partial [Dehalococcoidia bacterium]|nr:hypothetical protein [Dehalococcoidia bacterium]
QSQGLPKGRNPCQRDADVTGFGVFDKVLLLELEECEGMASWEQALIEAVSRVSGGENPIQNIDHEAKVIEINRDARIDPSFLRTIERMVEELGIGYRVEQLS